MADPLKDRDGNTWQPFVNQFQQRQLHCVAGPRQGNVIHDPRLGEFAGRSISGRDPVRPVRDSFAAGLFVREFSELDE
jgi:hypothetical protein